MSTSPTGYKALYDPPRGHEASLYPVVQRPVVRWAKNGDALVADEQAGQLVPANALPHFARLERIDYPVVAALPSAGWRVSMPMGENQPDLVEDVMGWAVHADGTLSPITPGDVGQGELAVYDSDEVNLIPPLPSAGVSPADAAAALPEKIRKEDQALVR